MKKHFPLTMVALIIALLISGCYEPQKRTISQLNHDDTIAGPDTDNNGIRDDIDAYIATLPYTDVQKKAVQQEARAISETLLVDKSNKVAVTAANEKLSRSIACLHYQFSPETNDASKISADNEKMIVNTKNRFLEYEKFNLALSGTTWTSPDRGTSCDK